MKGKLKKLTLSVDDTLDEELADHILNAVGSIEIKLNI